MFDKILSLILFISPLFYVNGISIDLADLKAFPIYFSFLLAASVIDSPKRNIQWKYFSFFILACFTNLFLSSFNVYVLSAYVNLMLALGFIALVATHCDNFKMCLKWIFYAGIANCIVFFLQWLGFSPIIQNPQGEWGGIIGNAPRFGIYLSLLLPLAFFNKRYWEFAIFVLAGVLAKEFFVILIALFCLFIVAKKQWKYGLAGFILLVLILARQELLSSLSIRWVVWKPTIEAIFSNPIRGFGLGTFSFFSDQFIKPTLPHYLELNHAENTYSSMLQFIFGMGLGGIILIYYSIQYFIKTFKPNSIYYTIFALILLSTVEYPFEIIKLWPLICFILSMFIILQNTEGENADVKS
jgi:hypothetical protein